ncbi:ABC transporter permease [Clostridium vincentii]|uniref:ABC-2 family transporter protein n=1 Tax=Clostridium vincentii TaxID=52704 RepID=A0A2T0BH96_9CLOT|nr:ABC transporter permease [Clostridium vincentii]PRR83235.1 ABC-2 family transporter protein [Clostridium vincentii]
MIKLFKLSVLELQKIFKTKGIYLGIVIAMLFSIAIGIQAKIAPESFNSKHVMSFFSTISNLVFMVYASKSLGDEFQLKTSTQLFTSKQSRVTIILSKILSIILLSLVMAIISAVIIILFKFVLKEQLTVTIVLSDLWVQIYTFAVYAFVVSTFAILVTTITLNTTSTIVTTLGAFFIAPSIIAMIIDKFPEFENELKLIPFYSADSLTAYHNVGLFGVILIIAFGIIVLISNIMLIKNMDLR